MSSILKLVASKIFDSKIEKKNSYTSKNMIFYLSKVLTTIEMNLSWLFEKKDYARETVFF